MPPKAHSEPVTMVSHRSRSNATFAALVVAAADLVDDLDAAHGADAARRALAARFDGAELHSEPRLLAHVDLSSNTTSPPWPTIAPTAANCS